MSSLRIIKFNNRLAFHSLYWDEKEQNIALKMSPPPHPSFGYFGKPLSDVQLVASPGLEIPFLDYPFNFFPAVSLIWAL